MTDDELLATIMRRFMTGDGYWFIGDYPHGPHITIDTEVALTAEELERLQRIVDSLVD